MTGCMGCSLKGCAIITAKDHAAGDGDLVDHKPPTFQVLLIYNDDSNEYMWACTYSFGSETAGGNWSAPVKCHGASELTRCGPRAGIVTQGGTAHWVFMDERSRSYTLLNISAATSQVSSIEIPIKAVNTTVPRPPIPCIVGEEGMLSFVTVGDHGVADLWTEQKQDDEGDMVWQHSELANLGSETIGIVFFAESRGALLVQQGDAFSIVDLSCKEKTPVHLKHTAMENSKHAGGGLEQLQQPAGVVLEHLQLQVRTVRSPARTHAISQAAASSTFAGGRPPSSLMHVAAKQLMRGGCKRQHMHTAGRQQLTNHTPASGGANNHRRHEPHASSTAPPRATARLMSHRRVFLLSSSTRTLRQANNGPAKLAHKQRTG
ncbi:unnamed protein product [Triticum aestivum]|uniref:Uncharacterized protein n=1 Tax=Triticum aestivum TaxID=4565 RepID=A0A7H4LRG3_WHEAT|nr:unnamed protein product [Triticum aestivum]